tara:strand:- start:272 stop:694 length:423 start_codon:yes stop_codon:yes gene_type:complete
MSNHDGSEHFIVPVKYYVGTFIALLILTVITVLASQIDLGEPTNVIIAIIIAFIKASLVASIFMGLKWDYKFNTLILVSSLVFFLIFIGFTSADIFTRHYDHERADERINTRNIVAEPGSHSGHHSKGHSDSHSKKSKKH